MPKPRRLRVVVLLSGSGTLLQAVLDAVADGTCDAEVVAVGSDRAGAYGLERARAARVPTFVHPLRKGDDRALWDAGLAEMVASYEPDLVVSAGFMKLVGAAFLARFGDRFINTHPALLPSFPGAHAVRDSLAHGVKVTGCTVFVVDAGGDTGRIVAQEAVAVEPGDTEDSLHERIKVVERRMLVDTIARYATERTL
ncbi:MAG TPA: phosphoribosylglycinamide formyltransferase [Propionibacteriaceae bacterium]|nr:phosphoribosylglycinamide formyltransferase [Propionibacteriaceae bacterium]